MIQRNYNPDVLSCLANLSNDEVFTPPNLVNQMLNLLPPALWRDKDAKFLDPVTKTGIFLREIAKRLIDGLEDQIPDRQERINHIFKNQLYGIAITEITALLSRRSLYCSKTANGKYSVGQIFENEKGNILFDRIEHNWKNGSCVYCGANQAVYSRGNELETYAYQFIHTDKPEILFNNMKFDVIIGNPPYQLNTASELAQATPLYDKFVMQAIKLNPRYLVMIIPARWYSGGMGLSDFRNKMLNDRRISEIHDFPETSDCFPGLNIRGGVCYFLWDNKHLGNCKITTHKSDTIGKTVERPLLEGGTDVFIRYNEAISILKKVLVKKEDSFLNIVSSQKPFGFSTNFTDFIKQKSLEKNILIYRFGDKGYVSKDQIIINKEWVDDYKIFIPKSSPGGDSYPHQVLGKPIIGEHNSCCTETYIVVGPFKDKKIAINVANYMTTSFFRFLVILIKNTQDVLKKAYSFVPIQDFNEEWTNEKLYLKYGISNEEIQFINSLVREMNVKYG
jgi:site-specific DNA-methyltransferase (adenine-specific)